MTSASVTRNGDEAFFSRHPRLLAAARYTLGVLLAFGALNAFGGGYYGLTGAKDIPREWLEGSPFTDYSIPSFILFFVVGGAFLLAAIAVFARWRKARIFALGAGVIVLGWIAVQVSITGYVSWMQPTTAITAVLILMLASALPAKATSIDDTTRA